MSNKDRDPSQDESVTRELLYKMVWAEPMLKVAERFNVSSSYLARICTALNVPRPERGYWAKLAVGKAPPVPKLPAARPGDDLTWSPGSQPLSFVRTPAPRRPSRPAPLPTEHGLIAGALAHFEAGKVSSEIGYLKPSKKLLVDIVASQKTISKALSFANELFLALEKNGNRVTLAAADVHVYPHRRVEHRENPTVSEGYKEVRSPWRPTVAYVGTVAIGLAVIEMSEHLPARYVDGNFIRESEYTPPSKRARYTFDRSWTQQEASQVGG